MTVYIVIGVLFVLNLMIFSGYRQSIEDLVGEIEEIKERLDM